MKHIRNGLSVLLSFLGMVLFFFFLLPQVLGILPKVVLSGSMEPEIPVGSIAYIERKTKPEQIREGEVIAYQLGDKTEVLHRVLTVETGERLFFTKGDANPAADPGKVSYEQYLGREILALPFLGYGAVLLKSRIGKAVILILLAGFFLTDDRIRRKEGKGENRKGL